MTKFKNFIIIILTLAMCMTIFAGCGNDRTEEIEQEDTYQLVNAQYEVSGMAGEVEIWQNKTQGYMSEYRLTDGTVLLRVSNVLLDDYFAFYLADALSDEACTAAIGQMRDNLYYNLENEIALAYEEYISEQGQFYTQVVYYDVSLQAENDTIAYLKISYIYGENCEEFGVAVNKETGEIYNNWDLFTAEREEVASAVLTAAGYNDEDLLDYMANSSGDMFIITSDGGEEYLEFCFPPNTKAEIAYSDRIKLSKVADLMQEWAMI
ncbi:MAG: hypothetical protein R3Y45_08510 [Bacillota bacterium]